MCRRLSIQDQNNKANLDFVSEQASGELGMTSRCMAAAQTNRWLTCERQLQLVIVTDAAILICSY